MTDRELLELAAKAAGYDVRWHEIFDCFVHVGPFNITNPPTMAGQRLVWVPLDDDGDALRLAVALRLSVTVFNDAVGIGRKAETNGYVEYPMTDDPQAATRRAITRAAAEIGKGMP
jgi:hypothetical protein